MNREYDKATKACPWCGRPPRVCWEVAGDYKLDWRFYFVQCSAGCTTRRFDDRYLTHYCSDHDHKDARLRAIDAWNSGDISLPLRVTLPEQHWLLERSVGSPKSYEHYNGGSMSILMNTNRNIAQSFMRKMPVIITNAEFYSMFPQYPRRPSTWENTDWSTIWRNRARRIEGKSYRFALLERQSTLWVRLASVERVGETADVMFKFEIAPSTIYTTVPSYQRSALDGAWKKQPSPIPYYQETFADVMTAGAFTEIDFLEDEAGVGQYGIGYR